MVKTVFRYDLPNPLKPTPPPKGESPTFQFRCLARPKRDFHLWKKGDLWRWQLQCSFAKMVRCVAPGCSNDSDNATAEVITFHKFPTNRDRKHQWVIKMERAPRGASKYFEPAENDRLCSKHFTPDCFYKQGKEQRRLLKKSSVPTIFAHSAPAPPSRVHRAPKAKPQVNF